MIMAKTKAASETIKGAEHFETAAATGAAALKSGFDKAVKNYDSLVSYSKETVEAVVKSAEVAGKGAETLHNEIYAFSKASVEETIAATKALMASKSAHEAFELQTGYAKSAFEQYVGQLTKLGEIYSTTTKQAFAPLQGRVQAWVDVVQSARAA
jgi:phasin family protein